MNVVQREGEPDIYKVPDKDKQMEAAIQKARKTVPTFLAALRSPKANQENFSIKKRFPAGENGEHMWLNDVTYDGKLLHGNVANDPNDAKNVKAGDAVTVAPNEISDWMYAENGKLVGGYTIRVLYNRMSAQEKKQFVEESSIKVE